MPIHNSGLESDRFCCRNAAHAAFTIVREEGISTLYRGVALTALRQATNQGKPLPYISQAMI